MNTITHAGQAITRVISQVLVNSIAGLLLVFTIVVFLQVITRFVIKMPLPWTEEVARFLFIWMVFLGSAVGVRKVLHYRIVMLIDTLPEKARSILDVFVTLFILVFFWLVMVTAFDFNSTIKMQKSPVMQISMGFPYSSVIAFGIFGLIFSIEGLFHSCTNCWITLFAKNKK
jgi:TRAP-type C4-dicarboxylate transport system permease small subunit